MDKNPEKMREDEWLKNLPVQAEPIAFRAEEMVLCQNCRRANPPTRLKCFYCAAALEIAAGRADFVKPQLRKLENWEKGFNLVCLANQTEKMDLTEMAKTLRLEKEVLQKIFETEKRLPLARTETEREAEIVAENLRSLGLETAFVSDDALAPDKLPRRLRGLDFADEKLTVKLFNTGETIEIARADLVLVVTGAVFHHKTEAIEKRKKGASKILESSDTASDEALIDLYSRGDADGFRISATGFDFSCLGADKSLLAAENMRWLIIGLREFAPEARLVSDYLSVREVLGSVWPLEQRKDSQGLKRHGFGKFDFTNVASSNNLQQFTKYSRLQWQLL